MQLKNKVLDNFVVGYLIISNKKISTCS